MNKKSERKQNLAMIIELLRRHGALTQAQLKNHCSLQTSTVSYLVKDLKNNLLIEDVGQDSQDGRIGKPGNIIRLNNATAKFLGIYANDDMLHAYLVGIDGSTLECEEIAFDGASVQEFILSAIQSKLSTHVEIKGVGVTIKAIVYADGSIKSGMRHRPGHADERWNFSGLPDMLCNAFPDTPILVENDANSAAELFHYDNRMKNGNLVVYLLNKSPFGIGCGLMVNGGIHRGARGAAGEFFEKDSKVRDISQDVQSEQDFVEKFMPAILPHILETAYLLDPERIVLSGSYFEPMQPKSITAVKTLMSEVPMPVEVAAGDQILNPAKGVALLATNRYITDFVEEVTKR